MWSWQFATGICTCRRDDLWHTEECSCRLLPNVGGPSLVRQRYEEAIEELDCSDGVLFLCDLFGGTPFNEASRLIAADEDYGIVTGLNLPLLIDLLTSRRKLNGSMAMRDLLAEVKRLAHEGVASLHMDDLDAEDLASGVAS